MQRLIVQVRFASPPVYGSTASPSGAYDTSARPDTRAALIRNVTTPAGNVGRDWNINHAGTPEQHPQVTDQPAR
jgi:hypothetical protein